MSPVSMDELRELASGRFGDMVKAVVDLYPDDPDAREAISSLVHRLIRR